MTEALISIAAACFILGYADFIGAAATYVEVAMSPEFSPRTRLLAALGGLTLVASTVWLADRAITALTAAP
jgi:hypothetical protein